MASAPYRIPYPLTYLRMKYTNWLDIETVTESTSLTLDTQDKADGNQVYILKSPLNEHELFVIEYKKAGERNYTGKFVDSQKGQNGYSENSDGSYNENMTVMNAALSDVIRWKDICIAWQFRFEVDIL